MGTSNRRTSTRFAVAIPARIVVDGAERLVTMLNLSLGGTLVETETRHPLGQRMQIRFAVPTQADAIDIGATVRWSDAKGVGLQFDGLRARDVWALNEYFKQLAS